MLIFTQYVSMILARKNSVREENKRHLSEKDELKLSLFGDNMIFI